jgi:hypothetical protein
VPLDYQCPGETSNNNEWSYDLIINTPPPGDIITDVNDYLKCFDLSAGAKLTLFVDQPTPNSRDTWSGWATDPDVGHTFIGIEQGNFTRFVGFYPTDGVNPYTSPSDPSSLVDDSSHPYDVKIELNLTAAQLTNIINFIKNRVGTYNLNNYNCTDFGLNVCILAGITLPDTHGSWPGGGGSNPGDLGEDIRQMNSTSAITVTKTSGASSSNTGICN